MPHRQLFTHASVSPSKMVAVENIIARIFPTPPRLHHTAIELSQSSQPWGREETLRGAKKRARFAFSDSSECSLGIGLESGIIECPGLHSGYIEQSICAFWNGSFFCLGFSSAFEVPKKVISLMQAKRISISKAFGELGLIPADHRHGQSGVTEFMTQNEMTRVGQNEQALIAAFARYFHPELYE